MVATPRPGVLSGGWTACAVLVRRDGGGQRASDGRGHGGASAARHEPDRHGLGLSADDGFHEVGPEAVVLRVVGSVDAGMHAWSRLGECHVSLQAAGADPTDTARLRAAEPRGCPGRRPNGRTVRRRPGRPTSSRTGAAFRSGASRRAAARSHRRSEKAPPQPMRSSAHLPRARSGLDGFALAHRSVSLGDPSARKSQGWGPHKGHDATARRPLRTVLAGLVRAASQSRDVHDPFGVGVRVTWNRSRLGPREQCSAYISRGCGRVISYVKRCGAGSERGCKTRP
jgi:hypothetical protein